MRFRRVLILAMTGTLLVACRSTEPPPREDGTGSVIVNVVGLPSEEGLVLVSLFVDEQGFPSDVSEAHEGLERGAADADQRYRFENVPAGPIAIAVMHDSNENYELDTNFLGIPTEDWGVSGVNDGLFGPPSFGSASVRLGGGEQLVIEVALSKVVDE